MGGCRYREEVRETEERTTKTIKKSLSFEKSGETFSIEISLENVSPNVKADTIISFLDTIYEHAKENLKFNYTSLN